MTARIYLIGSLHNRSDKNSEPPELKAIRAYCESRGWPRLSSEHYTLASKPGEHLQEVLSTLTHGDVLLVQSVAALSDKPSEQERIVRSLIGRGIRLHTLELGPMEQHLPGLFHAWAATSAVEQELDAALRDMEQMEARHAEDLKNFEETLYQKILAEGATFTIAGKANGHSNGHSHADPELGDRIKSARAKRNLSIRALGDLAGVSHSQVARLEQYGRGDGLEAVLKALGLGEHHAAA